MYVFFYCSATYSAEVAPIAIATSSALSSPEQGHVSRVRQDVLAVMNCCTIMLLLLHGNTKNVIPRNHVKMVKLTQRRLEIQGSE